ncbi:hypothetical protein Bhyg_06744, partial [Pseudolycoriella hygida]
PCQIRKKTGDWTSPPIYSSFRYGLSITYLPDGTFGRYGRLIWIGGQFNVGRHDFQVYNDVIVIKYPRFIQGNIEFLMPVPENFQSRDIPPVELAKVLGNEFAHSITIYGYPEDVFPRTSFHTASHIRTKNGKEYIYIIGGRVS